MQTQRITSRSSVPSKLTDLKVRRFQAFRAFYPCPRTPRGRGSIEKIKRKEEEKKKVPSTHVQHTRRQDRIAQQRPEAKKPFPRQRKDGHFCLLAVFPTRFHGYCSLPPLPTRYYRSYRRLALRSGPHTTWLKFYPCTGPSPFIQ